MRKLFAAAVIAVALVTAGCDGDSAQSRTLRDLQRRNAKLQQDLQSAGSISGTQGIVMVILSCALAASLFAHVRGGSRSKP